jgi:pimeloyl-ACP methyl ester carboxylesterase
VNEDSGFFVACGHRLEYHWVAARRPGLPVLVLLHQGLGSAAMWRDFPVRLTERTGCGALAFSRYGYGASDVAHGARSPDFLVAEGAEALPEVLAQRGLDDVILIGHSDGGTAALCYAAYVGRLRAAIVVAPHVRDEEITWRAIEQQRAQWAEGSLRGRLARYHRDPDAMFYSWADTWLSPQARGWSIEPLLPRIRVPLLAIQGDRDSHGSMLQIDNIACLSGGPVRLEKLVDCGHDAFRDQPEKMLALCSDFIAEYGAPVPLLRQHPA